MGVMGFKKNDRILVRGKLMIVDFVDFDDGRVYAIDLHDEFHEVAPSEITRIVGVELLQPPLGVASPDEVRSGF